MSGVYIYKLGYFRRNADMSMTHSLADLKRFHSEASQFFASELMMLKEVIPLITDKRLGKAATLLISAGQTGAALLQLANQTDSFTRESMMLARSLMEKVTNFCYVSICDEKEFRGFELHPVYKHYHRVGMPAMEDSLMDLEESANNRKARQEKLKEKPIVREALALFSETKDNLNWTKKTLGQRIDALERSGKFIDVFFTLNKLEYYSTASEALHGSLYGCIYSFGMFDPDFDPAKGEEIDKRLYKESACVLLHLGTLMHECFTLISYTHEIKNLWDCSYQNRGRALNLLFHVLGVNQSPVRH